MAFIFMLAAIFVAACTAPVQERVSSTNAEVTVGLLTTFEDCRLYKIWDGYRHIFVARCSNTASTEWTEHNGKSSTDYRVETIMDSARR